MSLSLRKAETALGVVLTAVVIGLHVLSAASKGALWRDEANTVGLVTLPTLGDVWTNLQFDSFPMLWLLIVRGFSGAFGPMNDPAFRALGLLVGVATVGALWFWARSFHYPVPLVSLALLGMTPSLIIWGDSLRGYGLGGFLILITGALLWRFVEYPSIGRFAAATIGAIASVHTLFYNSVLLLAFCAGAVAVCIVNRAWQKGAQVVLIGILAAISIVPYAGAIRDASSWTMLVQMREYTFLWFWTKLYETLRPGGIWALVIWSELFVLSLLAGVRAVRLRGEIGHSEKQCEVALFSVVSLVVGVLGLFLFLRTLAYPTEAWYYLPLLALAGVCIDAISGSLIHSPRARKARLLGVLLLAAVTLIPATRAVRTRLTNIDLVAHRLGTMAQPRDVVLVNPWYLGVSFSRYYRGPASWMTIPPLGFHRFHRYDLLKKKMMMPDQTEPVRPVIDRVGEALRTGHRVFVVGNLAVPLEGERADVPGPPLASANFLVTDKYQRRWSMMVGYFVQQHAGSVAVLPIKQPKGVSHYENEALIMAEGWRP